MHAGGLVLPPRSRAPETARACCRIASLYSGSRRIALWIEGTHVCRRVGELQHAFFAMRAERGLSGAVQAGFPAAGTPAHMGPARRGGGGHAVRRRGTG